MLVHTCYGNCKKKRYFSHVASLFFRVPLLFAKQEFSDPRDADDAQYNLDGREVDGSRIIVEFAKGVSCWLAIRFLNDHNIFFQASDLMSMCFDIERVVFQTSVTAGSSWFWWLT